MDIEKYVKWGVVGIFAILIGAYVWQTYAVDPGAEKSREYREAAEEMRKRIEESQ